MGEIAMTPAVDRLDTDPCPARKIPFRPSDLCQCLLEPLIPLRNPLLPIYPPFLAHHPLQVANPPIWDKNEVFSREKRILTSHRENLDIVLEEKFLDGGMDGDTDARPGGTAVLTTLLGLLQSPTSTPNRPDCYSQCT